MIPPIFHTIFLISNSPYLTSVHVQWASTHMCVDPIVVNNKLFHTVKDNLESQIRVIWMDGWVMSKCTQDSQNVCTKLLSLPDNAKKN